MQRFLFSSFLLYTSFFVGSLFAQLDLWMHMKRYWMENRLHGHLKSTMIILDRRTHGKDLFTY
jgi:hypothetical protein